MGFVQYVFCLKSRADWCFFGAAGKREWPPIQAYMHRHIERALAAWFGSVEVVRDCEEEFLPTQKYIFGYAPHGLFPIGAQLLVYLQYLSAFCTLFT